MSLIKHCIQQSCREPLRSMDEISSLEKTDSSSGSQLDFIVFKNLILCSRNIFKAFCKATYSIGQPILKWLISVVGFLLVFYIVYALLIGGTIEANRKIVEFFSSSATQTTSTEKTTNDWSDSNDAESKKLATDEKADPEIKDPAKEPIDKKEAVNSPLPKTPAGPMPNGPVPAGPIPGDPSKAKTTSSKPTPSSPAKSATTETETDSSENLPKVKLMTVDNKSSKDGAQLNALPARATIPPKIDVTTITAKSIVINFMGKMQQINIGDRLPDGSVLESTDPVNYTFTSNGNVNRIRQ